MAAPRAGTARALQRGSGGRTGLDGVAALDSAVSSGVVTLARSVAGDGLLTLDWAVRLLIDVSALKMGVPTAVAVYAWVRPDSGCRADPGRALRGAAGVVLTLALARAAQNLLSMRPRPRVAMPDFPFPPLGRLYDLADWSSMPSDTAALAFALVAVAWASSRRLGAAALVWAVSVTCLPRLYIGLHYLSDLLAGAALGVLAVAAALRTPLPGGAAASADAWLRRLDARAPGLLLLAFFRARRRVPPRVRVHPQGGEGGANWSMPPARRRMARTRDRSLRRTPRTRSAARGATERGPPALPTAE